MSVRPNCFPTAAEAASPPARAILAAWELDDLDAGDLPVHSPADGRLLARLRSDSPEEIDAKVARARSAFEAWRQTPGPVRGAFVRELGEVLRARKDDLADLVTLECGKIRSEALGEVQEMIDICDFAVGLSRQLHGLTVASERPLHKMFETWHPIGPVAVISAFNFPVAVWSWNAALALVCGDSVVWKPSEKTPLTALACAQVFAEAGRRFGGAPEGLLEVVIGGAAAGAQLAGDPRLPVVSATGSTAMGREVAKTVAARLGRTILELGGNNAIVVTPSADLRLAVQAITFGAVGTAGQRCTTTRRLFVHDSVYDETLARLRAAYGRAPVGDPSREGVLIGPLIDKAAHDAMQGALADLRARGCAITGGARTREDLGADAYYVTPALVEHPAGSDNVHDEVFAPILHVFRYQDLAEAIGRNNAVPQGLSSAIFTTDLREAELFTSALGSDCGIANVNIGTSGAEIGGAFGGEKDTGGGRESGSDAWKGYMRRQTQTTNYGRTLPLAQGVTFVLGET